MNSGSELKIELFRTLAPTARVVLSILIVMLSRTKYPALLPEFSTVS